MTVSLVLLLPLLTILLLSAFNAFETHFLNNLVILKREISAIGILLKL